MRVFYILSSFSKRVIQEQDTSSIILDRKRFKKKFSFRLLFDSRDRALYNSVTLHIVFPFFVDLEINSQYIIHIVHILFNTLCDLVLRQFPHFIRALSIAEKWLACGSEMSLRKSPPKKQLVQVMVIMPAIAFSIIFGTGTRRLTNV